MPGRRCESSAVCMEASFVGGEVDESSFEEVDDVCPRCDWASLSDIKVSEKITSYCMELAKYLLMTLGSLLEGTRADRQ